MNGSHLECIVLAGHIMRRHRAKKILNGIGILNSQFGLSGEPVQRTFQLQSRPGQLIVGKIPIHPYGLSPHEQSFRAGIGNLKLIPTRKDFFFEQAKVRGIIGNPVTLAKYITPDCTLQAGPLGPSGVTTRSPPSRPAFTSCLMARSPPRVLDPRMV